MKKAMFVPIALIAVAGNAQTPEDLNLLKATVLEGYKIFPEEGLSGLKDKSEKFFKEAIANKSRTAMVRCITFEFFCYSFDSSVFTMKKLSDRSAVVFNAIGFTDSDSVNKLISFIAKSTSDEMDKVFGAEK